MYSKLSIFLLVLVIILLAKGVYGVYVKAAESNRDKQLAQSEFEKLADRQAAITAQISSLKTAEGQEKEIRARFNVAKEGENVLILVDEEAEQEQIEKKEGFFGGLWRTLTSVFNKEVIK